MSKMDGGCDAELEHSREYIMDSRVPKNANEWWAHRQIGALAEALERMTINFKPFTMKPMGGEGSPARLEQEAQIAAHAEATRVLAMLRARPRDVE